MAVVEHVPSTPPAARVLRRMTPENGFAFWLAVGWLIAVIFVAVFAQWLPLPDPYQIDPRNLVKPPTSNNVLGTDGLGRDIFSRILFGARVSVVVSLSAVSIGLLIGGTIGMAVGFFRGRLERVIMAIIDVILAFPGLVLLLGLVAFLGQNLPAIAAVIGFLSIPIYTRVSRANTLAVANREFIVAAKALGASKRRLLFREIFPNVIFPLLAYALVAMGVIVVLEGSLAFLGLSVQPPTATWGSMIAEGKRHLRNAPHVALIPAAAMFLTVLSLNFVGDRLRIKFDVKDGD